MQCTQCKSDIPQDAKFCSRCGTAAPIQVPEPKQIPPIMNVEEAMEFLRVSRATFYQLLSIEKDPLPYFNIGARKRFITDEILEWAKRRTLRAV